MDDQRHALVHSRAGLPTLGSRAGALVAGRRLPRPSSPANATTEQPPPWRGRALERPRARQACGVAVLPRRAAPVSDAGTSSARWRLPRARGRRWYRLGDDQASRWLSKEVDASNPASVSGAVDRSPSLDRGQPHRDCTCAGPRCASGSRPRSPCGSYVGPTSARFGLHPRVPFSPRSSCATSRIASTV